LRLTIVGASPNTVRQYLSRVAPELEVLRTFKDRLGDSLALTQANCRDLENKLLDALVDDKVLATLTTTEKKRLLGTVRIAKGVTYDKWRLQTGRSTSNNSPEIQLQMVHQEMPVPSVSSGSIGFVEESNHSTPTREESASYLTDFFRIT